MTKEQLDDIILCNKTKPHFNGCIKYYISKNFGDVMNRYLMKFLFGFQPYEFELSEKTHNTLMCVGSIGGTSNINTTIWGTGVMYKNEKIPGAKKVCCIRGPLSKDIFTRSNILCPEIYCDPGVLFPCVFDIKHTDQTDKIAIIPHVVDKKIVDVFKLSPDKYEIIDLTDNPQKILEQISKCYMAFSSSLHGIIASESLGIPTAWIKLSNNVLGDGFKFYDYYLGSGRCKSDIIMNEITSVESFNNVKCTIPGKFNIYGLLKSCPYKMCEESIYKIYSYYENDN